MDYKQLLQDIYNEVLNSGYNSQVFENEYEGYIKNAIESIDKLWDENLENFKKSKQKVKLVILGEAPMWGGMGSYIYNEKSEETNFFRLTHLGVPTDESNKKLQLLTKLKEKGIIFLDVSPFPLNPNLTSLCYSNRNAITFTNCHNEVTVSKVIDEKIYREIIKETFDIHFKPKLKWIYKINKCQSPRFVYRYSTVRKMHKTIYKCCDEAKIYFPGKPDVHISNYGNINQVELGRVLLKITYP
jgi:hypothetical protein